MRQSLLLVAILMVALARTAAADPDAKASAREHYQKGSKAFSLGDFKDAVEEYRKGFQLVDDPVFLYNIAQAYRLDNNAERALFFYRSYLSRQPKASNAKEVQARIGELEKLVADQAKAQKTPPTRTISPDHEAAAESPAAEEKPAPATPTATASDKTAETAPEDPAATATPAKTEHASTGRTKKLAGIGLLVGGAALVVTGVVMSVLANQAAAQINADGNAGKMFNPALESSVRTYDLVGPVLDAVGGAAMVAGAVVLTLGVRDAHRAQQAMLLPSGGHGHVGLVLSGGF